MCVDEAGEKDMWTMVMVCSVGREVRGRENGDVNVLYLPGVVVYHDRRWCDSALDNGTR